MELLRIVCSCLSCNDHATTDASCTKCSPTAYLRCIFDVDAQGDDYRLHPRFVMCSAVNIFRDLTSLLHSGCLWTSLSIVVGVGIPVQGDVLSSSAGFAVLFDLMDTTIRLLEVRWVFDSQSNFPFCNEFLRNNLERIFFTPGRDDSVMKELSRTRLLRVRVRTDGNEVFDHGPYIPETCVCVSVVSTVCLREAFT